LCQDDEAAVSFCEASVDVPEDWLDEIVIITVNADALDASLFELDKNIADSSRLTTYQYRGDIPTYVLLTLSKVNDGII
jgi:hypothetical protein